MKILILLGLSLLLSSSSAKPLSSYDQRQDGELNVKVDLDNFMIVVARPSTSGLDLLGSMASLLADTRSSHLHRAPIAAAEEQPPQEKSKGNLDDVSMDDKKKPAASEEAVVLLVQQTDDDDASDKSDVARTLRNMKMTKATGGEKSKFLMSSKYKFVDSVDQPQTLKLIGDAIENCGPGRSRDRFGICKQE